MKKCIPYKNECYLLAWIIFCLPAFGKEQSFNYYTAYEVHHKDRTLGIDACDLDPYEGETAKVESPLKKPEKLYLLTEKGPVELNFIGTKRVHSKVCDSNLPRNLWMWKSQEEINRIPLIVDTSNLKFKYLDNNFKKFILNEKDWEKLATLNGKKKWSGKGNKECNAYSSKEFLRLECEYTVYLFRNHKLIIEHSNTDNYNVTLNLIGEVRTKSETYYFITFYNEPSRPLLSNNPSILKSESGKEIYPVGCSLPSGC